MQKRPSKLLRFLIRLFKGALLAFFTAGSAAHAQNAGSQNDVSIEQIGPDNLAVIRTAGQNNHARVMQTGSGNRATIVQGGTNNGTTDGVIDQSGEANEADVEIDGDDNQYVVTQRSDGATNRAEFSQTGIQNNIDIFQDATGLTSGLANSAQVFQDGAGNSALINQTSLVAGLAQFNNMATINQTGNDNLADVTQNGNNNTSEQEQVGDNNRSSILQNGDDNLAIHRQFGDNLDVPGYLGGVTIEQFGGASVTVVQHGPNQ